jgi:hypothetical protein
MLAGCPGRRWARLLARERGGSPAPALWRRAAAGQRRAGGAGGPPISTMPLAEEELRTFEATHGQRVYYAMLDGKRQWATRMSGMRPTVDLPCDCGDCAELQPARNSHQRKLPGHATDPRPKRVMALSTICYGQGTRPALHASGRTACGGHPGALFKTPCDREEEKPAGCVECVIVGGVRATIVGMEYLPVLEVSDKPLNRRAKRRDLGIIFLVGHG